jgi:hypothetical protein
VSNLKARGEFRGIDMATVSSHTGIVAEHGLRHLLQLLSSQLTVGHQPGLVYPPVPAVDIPGLVPPLLDPGPRFADITAELSAGGQIILDPSFIPNQGVGVRAYPESFAPMDVIQHHTGKDQRQGLLTVITLADAQAGAIKDGMALHVAQAFIAKKGGNSSGVEQQQSVTTTTRPHPDAEPLFDKSLLGRLVLDFVHGPNFPDKSAMLALLFGAIVLPTLGYYCFILMGVRARWPGSEIWGFKTDFASWFKRMRLAIECTTLCAFLVVIDGVQHVAIPVVEQFGLQEASFHSNFASGFIHQLITERSVRVHGIPTGSIYSDDYGAFMPLALIPDELRAISEFADQVSGPETIAPEKNVLNQKVELIGYLFDIVAETVTVSFSMFLKLVALFFLETPSVVEVNSVVTVTFMQRL